MTPKETALNALRSHMCADHYPQVYILVPGPPRRFPWPKLLLFVGISLLLGVGLYCLGHPPP